LAARSLLPPPRHKLAAVLLSGMMPMPVTLEIFTDYV
jgi:hypothetical protein